MLAQGRGERIRGASLGRFHPLGQALELTADDVCAEADALVAQGQQADAQRALGEAGALRLRRLLHEAGQLSLDELEVANGDPVAGDGDLRAATHEPMVAGRRDS